jgi:hypothetical protein
MLSVDAILSVEDGQEVQAGDVLARIPREAPRPATSPAVCRGWRSCSRRASQGSRDHRGDLGHGRVRQATTRTSAASRSSRRRGESRSSTWSRRASTSTCRKATSSRRATTSDRRQPGAARHPGDQGRRGAGRIPRQRDPGGLSAAGREDQRQAHRGDRSPDAAEGRDHRRRRHDLLPGEQVDRIEFDEENEKLPEPKGKKPATGHAGAARHHQGEPADPLVHLGGLVPGDDPRAHRGGGAGQGRHADGLKENVIVGRLIPAGTGAT